MRKYILNLIIKLFGKHNITSFTRDLINQECISKCIQQVDIMDGSRFYETATVYNAQNNKSKIIIGENTHIRGELLVFKYGGKIQIGNDCFIGDGTRIWSGESVSIGNNVLISHNVSIVDTNAHELNHSERAERYKELIRQGPWGNKGSILTMPVLIKDNAWISFGATILKSVTIGKGAIVAANAVVTKDVPDFTMVAGNPAKQIKKLKHV